MPTNDSWGRRLRDAKRDFEKRHDTRLTYAEIGERVSALLKRDRPFASTSVRSWFVEGQEPEAFAITAALAQVLEADPGDLAFGDDVPSPSAPTMPLDSFTPMPRKEEREAAKKGKKRRA